MVHLTRDDRGEQEGATASENFTNILATRTISALNAHCLHRKRLTELDKKQQAAFKVACFTETPLHELKHLVKDIPGRRHKLSSYGFVFDRQLILEQGGQPVTYVSNYGNGVRRKGYDQIFETAKSTGFKGQSWRVLPLVSAMHDGYDFGWERECRLVGDFSFAHSDLVCVILPSFVSRAILDRVAKVGVRFIKTSWSYERAIAELCLQSKHRRTNIHAIPMPS